MKNLVELDLEIIDSSDMAIQVSDGSKTPWLPRSQIEFELCSFDIASMSFFDGDNCMATITMLEWLAFEKGLI